MSDSLKSAIEDLQRHSALWRNALTDALDTASFRSLQDQSWLTVHQSLITAFRSTSAVELAMERQRFVSGLEGISKDLEVLGTHWKAAMDESSLQRLEIASAQLTERFRLPQFEEVAALSAKIEEQRAILGATLAPLLQMTNAISKLSSPWIDSLRPLASLDSIARLAALGESVRSLSFDPTVLSSIAGSLGNWSDIPESLLDDSLGRETYLIDKGFDSALIALPEPAFTESLEATYVLSPELLIPDPDLEEFAIEDLDLTEEEGLLFQRSTRAFKLLRAFERHVRDCLHQRMTDRYGDSWERNRTPDNGKTFANWKHKQEVAVKNGEAPLALIQYADFTDYAKVILRKDNWKEVFSSIFRDEDELRVAFRRIERIRVVTMHGRTITKSDLLALGLETSLILSALGLFEDK